RIPSVKGADESSEQGAKVADVTGGHGASTIIMAKAYQKSEFWAFDNHEASVKYAQKAARDAGVENQIHFEAVSAQSIPDKQFDLITFFDCLHDMGDPVGACKR